VFFTFEAMLLRVAAARETEESRCACRRPCVPQQCKCFSTTLSRTCAWHCWGRRTQPACCDQLKCQFAASRLDRALQRRWSAFLDWLSDTGLLTTKKQSRTVSDATKTASLDALRRGDAGAPIPRASLDAAALFTNALLPRSLKPSGTLFADPAAALFADPAASLQTGRGSSASARTTT
jgi:hypothetical protein